MSGDNPLEDEEAFSSLQDRITQLKDSIDRLGREAAAPLSEDAPRLEMPEAAPPTPAWTRDLPSQPIDEGAAQALPESVCRHFHLLPFDRDEGGLRIAAADPGNERVRRIVEALAPGPVTLLAASQTQIDDAIDRAWSDLPDEAPGAPSIAPPRGRLGEMLVDRGAITTTELDLALEGQERNGSRLGEILHSEMALSEAELTVALADQLNLDLVDVDEVVPSLEALAAIPESLQREGRCVPLAITGDVLHVAVADPLDDESYQAIRALTDLRIRNHIVERSGLEALLRRIHLDTHVRAARSELLTRFPEDSANRVLSRPQRAIVLAGLAATVAGLVWEPLLTGIIAIAASLAIYSLTSLYKLKLFYDAFGKHREFDFTPEQVAAIDERKLPRYSVLVPLFDEATVVPRLAASLRQLDYPTSKLEVLLLCEEGDAGTIEVIEGADLPPHFKLIVVPDSEPKTKPKACNYGIQQATGEFVVVYDAEDQPESDQLKKALLALEQSAENVICVQAKLNYFNTEQNLLTRLFATEYALWFDLFLPGLDHADSPIPLGGTSNHFNRKLLMELGSWDPFNVTEDADLGVRLHKAGYRTVILNSTTLEEANSRLGNWLRQRSRWVKGYLQTYLVHMRHPFKLMGAIGWRGWWSFQFMVGGTIIYLLNPIYWVLTALWIATEAGTVQQHVPGFVFYAAAIQLLIGNFVFTYLNIAGVMQRGLFHLVRYALLSPIYWGLMSIGAWMGLFQLFTKPFYWEKTEHGLDRPKAA